MGHMVIIPGREVFCEWNDGKTTVNVWDGVHFCGSCGKTIPDVRNSALCQDVCPGHHNRYGAGENLTTSITWCPGVERADDSDPAEWYDNADEYEYVDER